MSNFMILFLFLFLFLFYYLSLTKTSIYQLHEQMEVAETTAGISSGRLPVPRK